MEGNISPKQAGILELRKNRGTVLSKPGFGISFQYPSQFSLKFDEEVKDVLMLQFLIESGADRGEFTLIAGPDEAASDIDRAMASLELITNMVGPELFQNVNKAWIEKNLEDCQIGTENGKKMLLKSPVISFGIYFAKSSSLKYHFFVSTPSSLSVLDSSIMDLFKTVEFSKPVVILTPLVGETMKEYFNNNYYFSILYPDGFEVNSNFPANEPVGDNDTINNASCLVEFKNFKPEYGITIRVVVEKTKIKFSDYLELFRLQLTKSRILLATVKESKVKMSYASAMDFEYIVDNTTHIKRVGIIDGHAFIISIEHYGTSLLKPEKLFASILRSFKYYGGKQEPTTTLRYIHFDKDFSIQFPDHCVVLYQTTSVVVVSLSKKDDPNGCFIQILDYQGELKAPTTQEIFDELLHTFESTCSVLYRQEPKHTSNFGPDCEIAELLIDGTWFVNPILNHPHLNSKGIIRVLKTPKYTFIFCFINDKNEFNKTWEQYGRLMLDSVHIV